MKELENKHNQEIIRLEKSFKLQCNSFIIQPQCRFPVPRPPRASFKAEIDRIHFIFTSPHPCNNIIPKLSHFFSKRMDNPLV